MMKPFLETNGGGHNFKHRRNTDINDKPVYKQGNIIEKENSSPEEKQLDIYEFASSSQGNVGKTRNKRKLKSASIKPTKRKRSKIDENILKMSIPALSAVSKQSIKQNNSFCSTPKIFKHKHDIFYCSTPNNSNEHDKQMSCKDNIDVLEEENRSDMTVGEICLNNLLNEGSVHISDTLKQAEVDSLLSENIFFADISTRKVQPALDTSCKDNVLEQDNRSNITVGEICLNNLLNEGSVHISDTLKQAEVDGLLSENILVADVSTRKIQPVLGVKSPLKNEITVTDSGFESILFNDVDDGNDSGQSSSEEFIEHLPEKAQLNVSHKYECTYLKKPKTANIISRVKCLPPPINVDFWLNKSKTFCEENKINTIKEQNLLRTNKFTKCVKKSSKAKCKKRGSLSEIEKKTKRKHLDEEKRFKEAAKAMNASFREVEKFKLIVE